MSRGFLKLQKPSVYASFSVFGIIPIRSRLNNFAYIFSLVVSLDFFDTRYICIILCYHFVIEADNKNNLTVDNMKLVRKYCKRFYLEIQGVSRNH